MDFDPALSAPEVAVTPGRYLDGVLKVLAPVSDTTDDLAGLSDSDLHERYVECRRRERTAAADAAAVLGEITRRGSYFREGFLSATAFVAHRAGDSFQTAAGLVRIGRALREMPHTAAAYTEGGIDTARVRRLIDAHQAAPVRFIVDELSLVERACDQDAVSFAETVGLWRQQAAPASTRLQERERFEARRLTYSETFEGMIHLQAEFDPVSGETVIAAIGALAGPANRDGGDGRTPTQRRVDALAEVCRYYLDAGVAPTQNGHRPHLSVIVDLDGLTGGTPTRSQIGHRRVLDPAAREMLACDATVCGVAMSGSDEMLRMGRRARTATPTQHRALAIRDQGCVIEGCGRPPEWCDAHHLVPWTHGGLTNTDNMTLLCRPHHQMIHHGMLQLPQRE